jgi:hypothetical protein
MSNISDRGTAGVQPLDAYRQWQQDRERRGTSNAPEHPLLGDVRSLTREHIDELSAHYGSREAAAGRIAAAAAVQLASVRIATGIDDTPPARKGERSMYERLREIDGVPELTADDKAQLKSNALRRYGHGHVHGALRAEAEARLIEDLDAITGRGEEVARALGDHVFRKLLATPKHERRQAIARALEWLEKREQVSESE